MDDFADTSHFQAVDLAAYTQSRGRIVIKATGGALDGSLRFVDSMFAARWRRAGELGLARVAYHFARNGNTGADEFAWCWSQIQAAGGMGPRDVLCYDQEDNRGATVALRWAVLRQRLAARVSAEHVDRLTEVISGGNGQVDRRHGPMLAELIATAGGSVGPYWSLARQRTKEFVAAAVRAGVTSGWIYSGKWYLEPAGIVASDLPQAWQVLWISDYTSGQADQAIEVPAGWKREQIVARQYTDNTSYPGIPAPCDGNRVLREWLNQEDDMPLSADDATTVWSHDVVPGDATETAQHVLTDARAQAVASRNEASAAKTAASSILDTVTEMAAILAGIQIANPPAPDPAAVAAALDYDRLATAIAPHLADVLAKRLES